MNIRLGVGVFLLLLVPLANGRPLGPIDLRVAAAQADFIVIGDMREGFELESKQALHVEGNVHVLQSIAGEMRPGAILPLSWDSPPLSQVEKPTRHSITPQLSLWFVKKLPSGGYTGMPVHPGSPFWEDAFVRWPAVCPAPPQADSANATERVIRAIGHALACMANWPGMDLKPVIRLQGSGGGQQVSAFMNEQQAVFWQLAEAFSSLKQPAREEIDQSFARSSSPHLQLIGLADLIREGRPQAVLKAEQVLDWLKDRTLISALLQSVSVYHNDSSPDAVRALGLMATKHGSLLTKSAAHPLRIIHTQEAMPFLVALLDDVDPQVQSTALSGICSFILDLPTDTPESRNRIMTSEPCPRPRWLTDETERNCWLGGGIPYTPRPKAVKDFWRTWWLRHGVEVLRAKPEPRNSTCQPPYPRLRQGASAFPQAATACKDA